jgi:hypothetical protein
MNPREPATHTSDAEEPETLVYPGTVVDGFGTLDQLAPS